MRKRLLHQFTRLLATLAGRLFSRRPLGSEKQRRPRTSRAARCRFERLEAREVFNATYHGGALLPHVEAQAVYLGSDWNTNTTEIAQKAQLDSYLLYLVQSPYMDLLTDHAYNVGQGTASPGKTLPVTLNKTNAAAGGVSDATIQADVQAAITAKILDQPDQNKLYVVFVEQGVVVHNGTDTSASTFLGYHSAFAGLDASNVPFDIHYAVVSYPSATTATGFNPTSASQGFVAADEFQTLTLSGTSGGSLTPAFGGVSATTAVTRTDEVQTITLLGAAGDTVHLSFGGASGTDATALTFAGGNLPAAADVQSHLNSIATLTGNVLVTSSVSGVYTVKFRGGLTGVNVSQIAAVTTGTATASIVTATQGSSPTAAQVQASLSTIAALSGNVSVTGNTGGPYSIQVRNLGNVAPIDVSTVTGGLTASIGTVTDGLDGVNDDFDQLTSVASHELAEAVTDPDVNYKTLGWFDDANNVEIGDLTLTSIADRLATSTRLNGFYTQHLFAQDHTIAGPDATSTPFVAVNGTTALQNVTVQTLTLSRAQVSWTPVAGAVGYRVLLVNGTQTTLLSRVAAPATSTILTGLPPLVSQSLRVEAYNAVYVTDPVTMSLTMPLPNVVAPQNVKATALSSTSVLLTWTGNGGAVGYRIFMISGTRKFLVATASEAATSATINGLKAGSTVSFRVEAFRGSKVADSALVSVKLSTPALAAPTVTIAAVGGNNSVAQLSWNTVAGAKGYRVYYLKGNQRILLSSLGASATTTTISGLPARTQFSVQAFSGSKTAASKWVHL